MSSLSSSQFHKYFRHCGRFPVCGFDCEWVTVNSERRKIALIQLCSPEGLCALIRLCKFTNIPLELRKFLEDPEIIKVGVTPANDAKYLQQDYAINMNGTFDLRFLALMAQHKAEGLGKMSKSILGIELDKDWHIRCSDWEIELMSAKQIDYAANDAFVAIEIFRKLYNMIRPSEGDRKSIIRFCDDYTDVTFSNKLAQLNLDPAAPSDKKLLKAGKRCESSLYPKHLLLMISHFRYTKDLKRAFATRTSPLYNNSQLQAPDGELLCSVDRQKAEWYVKNGLGETVPSEAIHTVRLKFEPAGRARGDVGVYYQAVRENRCVVCGAESDLLRKHIVPHEYRKFFPEVMKSKTSHDVLLLCLRCHQNSNISDIKIRRELEATCTAPLSGPVTAESIDEGRKIQREQRLARALCKEKNIPESRRDEMMALLRAAYPGQEINETFLKKMVETKRDNVHDGPSHGQLVVEKYKDLGGLIELEMLWRQHFLDSMKPQFMPTLWDINHNGNRLKYRASEGRVEDHELKIAGVDAVIMPKTIRPLLTIVKPAEQQEVPTVEQEDDLKIDQIGNINIVGTAAKFNKPPAVVVTSPEIVKSEAVEDEINASKELNGSRADRTDGATSNQVEDDDTSSDCDFRSAAGSRNSSARDLNRTLTEDDRYFSDAASMQSFYETIRSDGSTIDDFQSFASSLTERPLSYDSDGSRTSLCSGDLSIDSDTEVEDEQMGKMDM